MSPVFNNALAGASGQGAAPPPTPSSIDRSVRFNSADSAYLSKTPSTAGNRKTWTISLWLKRCKLGQLQSLTSSANNTILLFNSNDQLNFFQGSYVRTSTQVFRDCSAWYHIVVAVDTSNATAANRLRIYVNGNEITNWTTNVDITQNSDTNWNAALAHQINANNTSQFGSLYLADFQSIDGQALDPSSFGQYGSNNVWQPIEYSGAYGANGFHLDFSDNSTAAALGTDTSGAGNTWTANNISVAAGAGNDSLVDSPTNGTQTDTGVGGEVVGNYCTLNPLTASSVFTLTNGNLDVSDSGSAAPVLLSSIAVNSGKWYWEVTLGNAVAYVGAAKPTSRGSASFLGANSGQFMYNPNGTNSAFINGVQYNYSTASLATTGDIIGVALDFDANQIVFYKNGVSMGVLGSNVLGSDLWNPAFKSNQSSSATFNFGQRPFAYAAPSGHKALCTTNLPTPTIEKGSDYFDTTLYTGNGSTQSITGLNFSPDLVWIKNRAAADSHKLTDTVRGAAEELESDTTATEATNADGLTAFNSDGFNLGADNEYNTNNESYVAWAWDAGSSTVNNTDGTITSQVRVNASAGFSVVTTGAGGYYGGTVGHGLGVTPSFIILKDRNGTFGWRIYHSDQGNSKYGVLNSTAAFTTFNGLWNTNSTTFGTNQGLTNTAVAYCFAPVEGYSTSFSYTGNGNADGPFSYLGFLPKLILIKCSSTTGNWVLLDTEREGYNVDNDPLFPNLSNAEATTDLLDVTSNGFKIRSTNADVNTSAATYIGYAWASNPFQISRAR